MTTETRLLGLWSRPPDDRLDPLAAFPRRLRRPRDDRQRHHGRWPISSSGPGHCTRPSPSTRWRRWTGSRRRASSRSPSGRPRGTPGRGVPRSESCPRPGARVTGLRIDVFTIDGDGRISAIWVLADELHRILQVVPDGALRANPTDPQGTPGGDGERCGEAWDVHAPPLEEIMSDSPLSSLAGPLALTAGGCSRLSTSGCSPSRTAPTCRPCSRTPPSGSSTSPKRWRSGC